MTQHARQAHRRDWLTFGLIHMEDRQQRVLTKETLIPLGLVGAVAAIAGTLGSWVATTGVATQVRALGFQMEALELRSARIEKNLGEATEGNWYERDAKSWARLLAAENPELVVPMPGD